MKENILQKQCMEYVAPLIRTGRCFLINHHGNAYSRSGLPDLQLLLNGITIACELKHPGKHILNSKQGSHQLAVLRKMKAAGAIVFWTNNLNEFKEVIDAVSQITGKQSPIQLGHLRLQHGQLL